MAGRVVLFGATGFTGRLAAEAMTRAGLAPVLAGRDATALMHLVGDLAGLGPMDAAPTWQAADASDPASVRALIHGGDDVLVSTVGPFNRLGRAAVDAAVDAGCGYVDSTGESTFIQQVFEQDGPRAQASGARLLTAFGYDYVPGNLAGALAIREARDSGGTPSSVEIGYFVRGGMAMSSGTRASVAGMLGTTPFGFRNGIVVPIGSPVASFDVGGKRLDGMAVGSSEAFALPRLDRGIDAVTTYLGWAGKWTKAASTANSATSAMLRVPGVRSAMSAGARRMSGEATGQGPSAAERKGSRTVVAARALDGVGRELSSVIVEGPTPYELTAELLAWAAAMLATGQAQGVGALGPVDAFGLEALESGCADMGLLAV